MIYNLIKDLNQLLLKLLDVIVQKFGVKVIFSQHTLQNESSPLILYKIEKIEQVANNFYSLVNFNFSIFADQEELIIQIINEIQTFISINNFRELAYPLLLEKILFQNSEDCINLKGIINYALTIRNL